MAIIIGLDSYKKITVVKTYKMLEFLGDWSRFKDFVEIVFSAVGLYFS